MTKTNSSKPKVKALKINCAGSWLARVLQMALLMAAITATSLSVHAQTPTFEVVRTNWVQRSLTNVVVVTMPRLHVVNEYRTNTLLSYTTNTIEIQHTEWAERLVTNLVRHVRTNLATKTLTNFITMNLYATNVTARYQTNWATRFETNVFRVDLYRTNRINAFTTNWLTQTVTNILSVEMVRTNQATVTLTNWGTVLLMKTNWVSHNLTNLATVNLPASPTETSASVTNSAIVPPKDFILTWGKAAGGKNETSLQLKSASDAATIIPASEWRVERADATVLLMGRGVVFTGELPDGDYRVTVKYHPAPAGSLVTLGGTIKVTAGAEPHQSPATVIDR